MIASFDPFQDDDSAPEPRFEVLPGPIPDSDSSRDPHITDFNPFDHSCERGANPTLTTPQPENPFDSPTILGSSVPYDPFFQPEAAKNSTPQNASDPFEEINFGNSFEEPIGFPENVNKLVSKVPRPSLEEYAQEETDSTIGDPTVESNISGSTSYFFDDSDASNDSGSSDSDDFHTLQDDRLRAIYDLSDLEGECLMRRCSRFASKEWKICCFRTDKNRLQLFRSKSHVQRFINLERAQREDKEAYCKLTVDIAHFHKCTPIKYKNYRVRKGTTTKSTGPQVPEAKSTQYLSTFNLQRIEKDNRINVVRFASPEESDIKDLRNHLNKLICRARYRIRAAVKAP